MGLICKTLLWPAFYTSPSCPIMFLAILLITELTFNIVWRIRSVYRCIFIQTQTFFMLKILTLVMAMAFVKDLSANDSGLFSKIISDTLVQPGYDTLPQSLSDTLVISSPDTVLRISNLPPYITLAADSVLQFQPAINKQGKYFWYLRNAPIGLQINNEDGRITFKAAKTYFLSGKLKYDHEYKVLLGVNKPNRPDEKIDTSFTLLFYNTEIIPSKIKLSVSPVVSIEEGDTLSFKVQCETGSFPIENITYFSNIPLKNPSLIRHCDDEFSWRPGFDFVKDSDSGKVKIILINFIGSTRFQFRDTTTVKVIVRDALNYPLALQAYQSEIKTINRYILELKYSFLQLDKSIKRVKNTRTVFDITSSATALSGTIMSTSADEGSKQLGKILPSIGLSIVPVKEAVSPQRVYDQNQASLVRTSIRRLEYRLSDNGLIADRDMTILQKTNQLKDEIKQIQLQLIDIPIGMNNNMTEEELDAYFNSPKVMKKYRLKH